MCWRTPLVLCSFWAGIAVIGTDCSGARTQRVETLGRSRGSSVSAGSVSTADQTTPRNLGNVPQSDPNHPDAATTACGVTFPHQSRGDGKFAVHEVRITLSPIRLVHHSPAPDRRHQARPVIDGRRGVCVDREGQDRVSGGALGYNHHPRQAAGMLGAANTSTQHRPLSKAVVRSFADAIRRGE